MGPESPPRRRPPLRFSLVLSLQEAGGRLIRAASLSATLTGSQGRGLGVLRSWTHPPQAPPCSFLRSAGWTAWTLMLPLRPVRAGEGIIRTYLSRTHIFN